jgi:outer membrane receptor for ferrienterochelin and colicin
VDYLTYLSPRYLLSLNLFSNKLDGLLIRQVDIKDNTFNTFISNSGYWQTRGIELSLQAQPTEALELELSLTYQTTKDRDNSELTVAYSPQWLGQVKAAYHVNSKTKLALTGYYVSQMESYFDLTKKNAQGGFGARIGETSDAYFVLNTNLRLQDWWIKGIFANLHLYNVLDTEIRYPTTTENTWADKGLLGPGRTVLFNIGYQF